MELTTLILFVLGIGLLIVGAELLVKGASTLAAAAGISPLIIGLTVVAFGTSSPELAVSLESSLGGEADIALGNVVGSNIFNVLFILGLSALVTPLTVSRQLIRLDVPVMIAVSIMLLALAWDGGVSRLDAAILVIGLALYLGFLLWMGRRENGKAQASAAPAEASSTSRTGGWPVQVGLVIAGLGLLVLGSHWLVDGAVEIAQSIGVSELVIGLTIVAAGTSLPEVATSILAGVRGQRDIAVGNVIGSCIFNILAVLGLSGLVSADGIAVPDAMVAFDLPVMLAVAVACLPIFATGWTIARWEGGLFLAYYVAYTGYLILDASDHDALDAYSSVMTLFVVPITVVTLGVVLVRNLRAAAAMERERRADRDARFLRSG